MQRHTAPPACDILSPDPAPWRQDTPVRLRCSWSWSRRGRTSKR